METRLFPLRTFNPDRGGADEIRDSSVFLYFPHGFGDWVFLSFVLPLFHSSNRYFVNRFGDDNVSLFEGSAAATPLYTGYNRCGDGDLFGNQHFGLRHETLDGTVQQARLPVSL